MSSAREEAALKPLLDGRRTGRGEAWGKATSLDKKETPVALAAGAQGERYGGTRPPSGFQNLKRMPPVKARPTVS